MQNTTAIIQARMSSSRLPGKVLLDIAGQPMLVRMVERARRARSIEQVVVATTTDPSDDPIEQLCAERGYDCFRGSLPDVLDRYTQAARQFEAHTIVRLTADCPLLDPAVLDLTVEALAGNDFAANRLPPPWTRSLPIGLDVEVVTREALERAWHEAQERYQREHVLPYIYEGTVFDQAANDVGHSRVLHVQRYQPARLQDRAAAPQTRSRGAALDSGHTRRPGVGAPGVRPPARPASFHLVGCAGGV